MTSSSVPPHRSPPSHVAPSLWGTPHGTSTSLSSPVLPPTAPSVVLLMEVRVHDHCPILHWAILVELRASRMGCLWSLMISLVWGTWRRWLVGGWSLLERVLLLESLLLLLLLGRGHETGLIW